MRSRHKLLNMLIYKNDTKCRDIPVAAIETEMEMISKEEIGKEKTNKPFSVALLTTFSTVLVPAWSSGVAANTVFEETTCEFRHIHKCANGKHHGSPGLSKCNPRYTSSIFQKRPHTQRRGFAPAQRRERRLTYMALSPSSSYRLLAVPPPGLPVGSAIWMRAVLAHSAWRLDG